PAGPDLLTEAAKVALERVPARAARYVRTMRHPSASIVTGATSFDDLYDRAATIEEVYAGIVDALAEAAEEAGEVLYAVPGSPLVAERAVELLLADDRVAVEVVPGLSFLDLAWARLGVDPLAAGVRLVDGRRFGVEAAGERGPLLVAQCDSVSVLSQVKLAVDRDPPPRAVVLHHLGLPDEEVREVAWYDLDKDVEPDHLTALYVPELAAPVAGEVARFAELVRTLRTQCPWDREQTHQTLTRHLLEETYEVLEAIEELDRRGYEHLEEELGDLLFQVVFHATLAAEEGQFTLADVARVVHDKLVGRHPHVFGDVKADTPSQVMRNWEHIKQAEKGTASLMDAIPGHLPSLLYAHKVQRKAASVGVDLVGAMADLRLGHETVGELLFEAVALAREAEVDPEAALRATAVRYRDRFMALERLAAERGVDLHTAGATTVDALWNEVQSGSESAD
ncbi:MAG: MazG family protein, partial [Actinomycetota bacterium]|nr:MazG family protein [Actinomycetota bacterium]